VDFSCTRQLLRAYDMMRMATCKGADFTHLPFFCQYPALLKCAELLPQLVVRYMLRCHIASLARKGVVQKYRVLVTATSCLSNEGDWQALLLGRRELVIWH
jgi:hypothetical protein